MLTKSDIRKLKEVFTTKDDFKRFATKDDLKDLVNKKDLSKLTDELVDFINTTQMATKKEIVDELGSEIRLLAKEVSSVLTKNI